MANTYTWQADPTVDAYTDHEGFDDCVFCIHWRLNAKSSETHEVDGEQVPYTATVYGTVGLDLSDLSPGSYIDKDDLTSTIVNDWVKATMGDAEVASLKAGLKANIDEQKNPTVETFTV